MREAAGVGGAGLKPTVTAAQLASVVSKPANGSVPTARSLTTVVLIPVGVLPTTALPKSRLPADSVACATRGTASQRTNSNEIPSQRFMDIVVPGPIEQKVRRCTSPGLDAK